jgi:hypothetical protein
MLVARTVGAPLLGIGRVFCDLGHRGRRARVWLRHSLPKWLVCSMGTSDALTRSGHDFRASGIAAIARCVPPPSDYGRPAQRLPELGAVSTGYSAARDCPAATRPWNVLWNWPSFMIASRALRSCNRLRSSSGLPSTSRMSAR